MDHDSCRRPARCSAPAAIIVMDDTACMVRAALRDRALLPPRVVRPVHAVPRGHRLARTRSSSASSAARARADDLDTARATSAANMEGQHDLRALRRRRVAGAGLLDTSSASSSTTCASGSARSRTAVELLGMPKITVDGTELEVTEGRTILQARRRPRRAMTEVEIPHYCYHPGLSIDGSCRICQVEVEKAAEARDRLQHAGARRHGRRHARARGREGARRACSSSCS